MVYVPNDHQSDGQSMIKPAWALDWFNYLPLTYIYIYVYIYIYIHEYAANKKMWDVSHVIAIFTRFAKMSLAFLVQIKDY